MLAFVEGFVGEKAAAGFLVVVAQLLARQFFMRGQLQRQIEQVVIEHRVTDVDAGQLAHAVDLDQIVVGQGEFPVEIERGVERVIGLGFAVALLPKL